MPSVSIIIAASESSEAIARAVGSIAFEPDVEILVISGGREQILDRVDVVAIDTAPGTSVPRLRRLGLDHAHGDVVLFTEDSCVFPPGWADGYRRVFRDPNVLAATGLVAPLMGDRLVDWGVFFCEYAPFVRPQSRPTRLAGNNFALRRSAGHRLDPAVIEESEVFARLASNGSMVCVRESPAFHRRTYTLAEAIRDRLRFGQEYGSRRARSHRLRALAVVVGPLVWMAQVVRLVLTVLRSRRHYGPFLAALPITLGLLTAWSVGEWLGWLTALISRKPHEIAGQSHVPATARAGSRRPDYKPTRSIV